MAAILTNNLIEDIFVAEETDGRLTMRCKACDQYNAKYTSKYTQISLIIKDLQYKQQTGESQPRWFLNLKGALTTHLKNVYHSDTVVEYFKNGKKKLYF